VTLIAERALLIPILDALVPPSGHFPGAGTIAVDHVLAAAAASPDLDALLSRALQAIAQAAGANRFASMSADDRESVLRRVEESQPEAFAALVRHAYFGYYGHPTVITALGLDPTPVQPRGHQPEALESPDLARVTGRGPIYRAT
jgi:Gluconate 2-dehydrogenase subunit 3